MRFGDLPRETQEDAFDELCSWLRHGSRTPKGLQSLSNQILSDLAGVEVEETDPVLGLYAHLSDRVVSQHDEQLRTLARKLAPFLLEFLAPRPLPYPEHNICPSATNEPLHLPDAAVGFWPLEKQLSQLLQDQLVPDYQVGVSLPQVSQKPDDLT